MGVATGCGCKEVYRFPHTTYPYSVLFYSSTLLFVHKKKMLFDFVLYILDVCIIIYILDVYVLCV